jgi:hypothetical protein
METKFPRRELSHVVSKRKVFLHWTQLKQRRTILKNRLMIIYMRIKKIVITSVAFELFLTISMIQGKTFLTLKKVQ